MTINDLISEFEITYELGSLGLPGFESEEIRKLLEINQYKLINHRFAGHNIYKEKFPDSPKRIDDLQYLVADSSVVPIVIGATNSYTVSLPLDYLHLYMVEATVDGNLEIAEQIHSDDVIKFQSSRDNENPYLRTPKFLFDGDDKLKVLIDSESILFDSVEIKYIKKPINLEDDVVDVNTELTSFNEDVYHEIVAMAVDNAISIVSPSKSQVSQNTLNKAE